MGIASILADGVGLMIGSLLATALLTCSAWWLAEKMHRPRLALLIPALLVTALLASPLEQSLFVRVFCVFAMVGMGLLWFIGQDSAALPRVGEHEGKGMALPAARDK